MRPARDAIRISPWRFILVIGAVVLASSNAWPAQGSKGTINISLGSIKQVGDLPQLVAGKSLADAGHAVTFHELNGNDQMVQALLRNEADFGAGAMTPVMTAIARGADLRILFETVRLDYVLAAKASLTSVDQLHGARVGIYSTGSDTHMALLLTLESRPAVKPQLLIGGFSSARVQAMLSGQMDASVIQFVDWLRLKAQGGDRFHILQTYATDFPDIFSKVGFVRTSLISQNRQLVDDYIRANVLAARKLKQGGVQAVEAAIRETLPKIDPAAVPDIAKVYSGLPVWPTDGGLGQRGQDKTYEGLVRNGFIPSGKKPFFERGPLDKVLKEIGNE